MVKTTHIQTLLETALRHAKEVDGYVLGTNRVTWKGKALIERAINLARHAAEELEDELLMAQNPDIDTFTVKVVDD